MFAFPRAKRLHRPIRRSPIDNDMLYLNLFFGGDRRTTPHALRDAFHPLKAIVTTGENREAHTINVG